jgi:hypothetical protein
MPAMTVSGLTMASAERQSGQRRDRQIHNKRSPEVNFERFLEDFRSTPIWWRRARFSSSRAARERKIEEKAARSVVRELSIGEDCKIPRIAEVHRLGCLFRTQKFLHDKANSRRHRRSKQGNQDRPQ